MSTAAYAQVRREADRKAYLDESRAANAMRADARRFRDLMDTLQADPAVYGPRAKDYRDGVLARLELVAEWCDVEADRRQDYAEQYRALLIRAHALEDS